MRHSYERWTIAVDVRADDTAPATAKVRMLLKHLWRSWGIRCRGFSEDAELLKLRKENAELRETVRVLTAGIGEEEGKA